MRRREYRSAHVRLLVWNMGVAGSSVASHERTWQYLRDEQDFDVALLQETRSPPAWARDVWASYVWKPKYAGKWGCAVLARSLELLEYEPDATFPWLTQLSGRRPSPERDRTRNGLSGSISTRDRSLHRSWRFTRSKGSRSQRATVECGRRRSSRMSCTDSSVATRSCGGAT